MNMAYFNKYMHFNNLNSKQPADIAMKKFIKSFKNFKEKKLWTLEYLPCLYESRFTSIHAKLFKEVIFPVLLNGYKNKNISLMVWLVKLFGNCYPDKIIAKKLDRKTDLQILKECYNMEPDNGEIIELYIENLMISFYIMAIDWNGMPSYGTDFMAKNDCKKLLEKAELIKKLDNHKVYSEYINNVEQNVKKYMKKFV